MRKTVFSLALAVAATIAFAADPVTLVWKPQVGAVHHFTFKSNAANVMGQAMTTSADMTETIKQIKDNGNVVVQQNLDHFNVMLGSQDLSNTPGLPSAIVETITNKPDGALVSEISDHPQTDSQRSDNIGQFVMPDHPVNVGDTWSYVGKANPAKSTYDYEISYTYKGTEQVDGIATNRVDVAFKEENVPAGTTAMTGGGTVWLDPADGELVKTSMKVKDADMGQLGSSDIDITIERK